MHKPFFFAKYYTVVSQKPIKIRKEFVMAKNKKQKRQPKNTNNKANQTNSVNTQNNQNQQNKSSCDCNVKPDDQPRRDGPGGN